MSAPPLPHRMHPPTNGKHPSVPVVKPADGETDLSSCACREYHGAYRRILGKPKTTTEPPPEQPVLTTRERWLSYQSRTRRVYITSKCQLCGGAITRGQQYRESATTLGNAHEDCVLKLPED